MVPRKESKKRQCSQFGPLAHRGVCIDGELVDRRILEAVKHGSGPAVCQVSEHRQASVEREVSDDGRSAQFAEAVETSFTGTGLGVQVYQPKPHGRPDGTVIPETRRLR